MEFYQPWSPVIYKSEMSEDFHSYTVDNVYRILDYKKDASHMLAGNIDNQWQSRSIDQKIYEKFLKPHIIKYIQQLLLIRSNYEKHESGSTELLFDPIIRDDNIQFPEVTEDNIRFEMGLGPWLNVQVANEFNPLHSHSGDLSGIMFIQIPEEIKEERIEANQKYQCLHGYLKFVRNDQMVFVEPKDRGILIFPSTLHHMVYPFKSDVERVTMSFNIGPIFVGDNPFRLPQSFT
tara:strand:- start:63 stop:764 length:702 start_codon:yes stop_codon:yes gene_type:complete